MPKRFASTPPPHPEGHAGQASPRRILAGARLVEGVYCGAVIVAGVSVTFTSQGSNAYQAPVEMPTMIGQKPARTSSTSHCTPRRLLIPYVWSAHPAEGRGDRGFGAQLDRRHAHLRSVHVHVGAGFDTGDRRVKRGLGAGALKEGRATSKPCDTNQAHPCR